MIKTLNNYVLLLPDKNHETIQFKGKETNILVSDIIIEDGKKINQAQRNYNTIGTVYAVPECLNFNLDVINKIKKNNTLYHITDDGKMPINISCHREIGRLTEASVRFDVDMELKKGDRVLFSYNAHKISKEKKLVYNTEFGEMYLVKYDNIYMTLDENNKPLKMINGYVLVEPDLIEFEKENGVEVVKGDKGLVLLAPKNKISKERHKIFGTIINIGSHVKRYFESEHRKDVFLNVDKGDKICYDGRHAFKLEYETHQFISEKQLYLIQRKDIYYPLNGKKLF